MKKLFTPGLCCLSFLLCFLILEFGMMLFFVQSSPFTYVLSSVHWKAKYWEPLNSDGLRGRELCNDAMKGCRNILVVGDSFAAGDGIEDYRNRFSNLLEKKLGPSWYVANLAECGWSTSDELQALSKFKDVPDIVVWSYFGNDVEGAAAAAGSPFPYEEVMTDLIPENPLLKYLVLKSYFLNTVYFHFLCNQRFRDFAEKYMRIMDDYIEDQEIWGIHRRELDDVIHYARANDSTLIVLVWPFLLNEIISTKAVTRVGAYFEARGVQVIDLSNRLDDIPPEVLIVHPGDPHPSETVHERVAELLCEAIVQSMVSASEERSSDSGEDG